MGISSWKRRLRRLTPDRLINEEGFSVNPVAATLFCGLVLVIVVYTTLEQTGAMARLGQYGPVLPLIIIAWLMYGIYRGFKLLKRRSARLRIKGPLYLRALMNDCLERTCGPLEKRLNKPEISSSAILNDLLLDKMLYVGATDCLRFPMFADKSKAAASKGQPTFRWPVFQTDVEYHKRPLPGEIRQVADMAARSRKDLKPLLERLKAAHQSLCTGCGDILSLLPPDPKKVEKIRSSYRYRPPTPERARRMVLLWKPWPTSRPFAMKTSIPWTGDAMTPSPRKPSLGSVMPWPPIGKPGRPWWMPTNARRANARSKTTVLVFPGTGIFPI